MEPLPVLLSIFVFLELEVTMFGRDGGTGEDKH